MLQVACSPSRILSGNECVIDVPLLFLSVSTIKRYRAETLYIRTYIVELHRLIINGAKQRVE